MVFATSKGKVLVDRIVPIFAKALPGKLKLNASSVAALSYLGTGEKTGFANGAMNKICYF
jgi:hypothetical protein